MTLDEFEARLNASVPAEYRPVSFAALIDSIDSRQLQDTVYELLIWHLRRAAEAEAQLALLKGTTE